MTFGHCNSNITTGYDTKPVQYMQRYDSIWKMQ